jgi:hypothetical protein
MPELPKYEAFLQRARSSNGMLENIACALTRKYVALQRNFGLSFT